VIVSDVKPTRKSDKKTDAGRRRFPRAYGIHNRYVLLAECGCVGIAVSEVGRVCVLCGGAVLTDAEKTS
jgi:hypothetical protein